MKLELYKPYKTRAGHKAVVVDELPSGIFCVAHRYIGSYYPHLLDGDCMLLGDGVRDLDLISEWADGDEE